MSSKRSTMASLWLKMQAITSEMEAALTQLERAPLKVQELVQRAWEPTSGPTVEILAEDLEALLRDGARYEYLRENWGRLVVHTDGDYSRRERHVTAIELTARRSNIDPQSLDQGIDAAIEREKANATAVPLCECNQGVVDHQNPGLCARCGRPLQKAPKP
jgi:hypothetical protein